jgi:hypothetical protein
MLIEKTYSKPHIFRQSSPCQGWELTGPRQALYSCNPALSHPNNRGPPFPQPPSRGIQHACHPHGRVSSVNEPVLHNIQ